MAVPQEQEGIENIRYRSFFTILVSALIFFLFLACGESSDNESTARTNGTEGVASSVPTATTSFPPQFYSPSTASCSAIALSHSIADIVDLIEPAVVFISAEIEEESFFFGKSVQEASGSGVIVSPEGYILTNNHVVEGASRLEVTLPGMVEAFEAEIIGIDPLTDLAVIKIVGGDFPAVPFGDAVALRPGNLVIAMGYPMALDQGATITLGVVSNTERSFTVGDSTYYDVIQTDAAINRGNSGGPLIDLTGGIVGINSVLFGGAQNIGFAVSANMAQPVYEALIGEDHRVIRPWLGVVLGDVTPDIAAEADLSRQSGVVIMQVVEDSPAAEVGLEVRDVITHFDGEEVITASQLIKKLWRYQLGDEVILTYWRDGEEEDVAIDLTVERPE